jgi:signal transduction histidine kinase
MLPERIAGWDESARAQSEAESRAACRQGCEVASLFALVLAPAFWLLDYYAFPEHASFFLTMRLACALLAGAVFWALRTPFGATHPRGLAAILVIAAGFMVDVMTTYTGGDASTYYAGVNIVLLAMGLCMPWSATWALFTSAVIIGGWVACVLSAGPITHPRTFVSSLAFIGTTTLVVTIATALRERARIRELGLRITLARSAEQRRDFMAKMSHELRTPIHVMVGYTDILLDEQRSGGWQETHGLLERIRHSGLHLHGLVSDLLDLAKVEAGKMEAELAPARIDEVVEGIAHGFRQLARCKGVALETSYPVAGREVVTDRRRLEQILTNLIGNAVKFTDRGRIEVAVHVVTSAADPLLAGLTYLEEAAPDGRTRRAALPALAIAVSDTGVGIRAGDLSRLAADFQQIDDAAARHGGTGLGLSISKHLARLLGGRLAVRSRYGRGTTFVLLLPGAKAAGTGARPEVPAA